MTNVKPLEWKEFTPGWYEAETIAGTYRIHSNGGTFAWTVDDEDVWHHGDHVDTLEAAKGVAQADYSARIMSAIEPAGVGVETRTFQLGDMVRKRSGSWWEGRVVGFYSTEQTPDGVCVQLDKPFGPVQIYPAAALTKDGEQ